MKSKTLISTIPFSGFYDSIHRQLLDDEIYSSMFTDKQTGCENNNKLSDHAYDLCYWVDIRNAYSREYIKNFAHEFDIKITFESLQSPKEYNFTTDRIFVNITAAEVKRIYKQVDKQKLKVYATNSFTSCDGFSSFYDPDFKTWGNVATWDHNQLGCLIACFVDSENVENDDTYERFDEYQLMESSCGNGFMSEVIISNSEGIERLFKIHDYLNEREERKDYAWVVNYAAELGNVSVKRITKSTFNNEPFSLGKVILSSKPPIKNHSVLDRY